MVVTQASRILKGFSCVYTITVKSTRRSVLIFFLNEGLPRWFIHRRIPHSGTCSLVETSLAHREHLVQVRARNAAKNGVQIRRIVVLGNNLNFQLLTCEYDKM